MKGIDIAGIYRELYVDQASDTPAVHRAELEVDKSLTEECGLDPRGDKFDRVSNIISLYASLIEKQAFTDGFKAAVGLLTDK